MALGRENLVGLRFGAWLVLEHVVRRRASSGTPIYFARCRCSCGSVRLVRVSDLKRAHTRRCKSCSDALKRCRGLREMWEREGVLYTEQDDARELDSLRDAMADELGFAPEERLSLREVELLGEPCPWEPPILPCEPHPARLPVLKEAC